MKTNGTQTTAELLPQGIVSMDDNQWDPRGATNSQTGGLLLPAAVCTDSSLYTFPLCSKKNVI